MLVLVAADVLAAPVALKQPLTAGMLAALVALQSAAAWTRCRGCSCSSRCRRPTPCFTSAARIGGIALKPPQHEQFSLAGLVRATTIGNVDHLIRDAQGAVGAGNWYAAVALALALPDSCAAIDQPGVRGRQRYIEWADSYIMEPYFSSPEGQPYLTGRELYLLRCAFLHAGELELEDPEPTEANDRLAMFEVLNRVYLYVSDVGWSRRAG